MFVGLGYHLVKVNMKPKVIMKEWDIYQVTRPLSSDEPCVLGLPPISTHLYLVGITDYDAIVRTEFNYILFKDNGKKIVTDKLGRDYDVSVPYGINKFSYAPQLILREYPDAQIISEEF